ncbi:MAG: glycosyltransferase family 4 protein [Flavipsychrobacter sp.]
MCAKKIQVISFQSLSASSGAGMARLGYFLSRELNKRGLLKNFIVHSKGKFETPFKSLPVSAFSRYYLFILNSIIKFLPIPNHKFRLLQEQLYDWFCYFRIQKDTGIIFTTNAYLKRTFIKAKKLGIFIVLMPGTPEENYIYDLVLEENQKLGITTVDAYTYKKRLHYFNQSITHVDEVIGSMPTVYTSYTHSNVFNGNVVKILGHMSPDFPPNNGKTEIVEDSEVFTVGFLAYTVILKGLHYLVDAWQEILNDDNPPNIKLRIGGSVEQPIMNYINSHFAPLKNVELAGPISDVSNFMQGLDLFVVPSLIDGGPATALEAAHNSVPVIITDNCGSAELLSRGEGGCHVVPIKDAQAIKREILWAYNNRAAAADLGKTGKENLDNYDMDAYISQVADHLEQKIKNA